MRRRDAREAAQGMFGNAGVAWEEYGPDGGIAYYLGYIDGNQIYRPFSCSASSYDRAVDYAYERAEIEGTS